MSQFAIYPSLRDRVVFVTGGASGIGAAHVRNFAAQGARVAFVDIADADAAALVASVAAAGHPAPFFQRCDLRDIDALRDAIATAAERLGPITVLVNNAAHDERHKFEDVTVAYWDERQAVNLRHQFFAIQAVAPMMRAAGGGSIVNFGSISWRRMQGGMPAYTTAKAAIEGLTPEAETRLMEDQALKQRLLPDDLARMVLWLAADDSRMCTGQMWIVDAGRS